MPRLLPGEHGGTPGRITGKPYGGRYNVTSPMAARQGRGVQGGRSNAPRRVRRVAAPRGLQGLIQKARQVKAPPPLKARGVLGGNVGLFGGPLNAREVAKLKLFPGGPFNPAKANTFAERARLEAIAQGLDVKPAKTRGLSLIGAGPKINQPGTGLQGLTKPLSPEAVRQGKGFKATPAAKPFPYEFSRKEGVTGPGALLGQTNTVHYTPLRDHQGKIHFANVEDLAKAQRHQDVIQKGLGSSLAAGAKALAQTTRPLHAVVAGLEGKNIAHGFLHGHDTFRNLGLPGPLAFAADVLGDPTTYVGGGEATLGRKALEKAISSRGVRELGSKGATVTFAGHPIPGVKAATGAAEKGVVKAAGAAPRRVRRVAVRGAGAVREGLHEVNPRVTPPGISKPVYQETRRIARTKRATEEQARFQGAIEARAIRKRIGPKNYQRVQDAIELGKVGQLPAELQRHARELQAKYPKMLEAERAAGVETPSLRTTPTPGEGEVAQAYLPRMLKRQEGEPLAGSQGRRVIKPEFGLARKTHKPLADMTAEERAQLEDLMMSHARRVEKSGRAISNAQTNQRLAQLGRELQPGKEGVLHGDEEIFRIKGADMQKIAPRDFEKLQPGAEGRYVALSARVEELARGGQQLPKSGALGRGIDVATRGFKRVATATPAFHGRNLGGDTTNMYIKVPGHLVPVRLTQAGAAVRALSHATAKGRKAIEHAPTKGVGEGFGHGVTIPGEGFKSWLELGNEARATGGIQTGLIGRELEELGRTTKASGRVRMRTGSLPRRWMQNRENLPRMATWLHFRLKGYSPERAAGEVADTHFDYGELSQVEKKVIRRVAPFYTWSARNIPFQSRMLLQRPGKYANIEKAREETAGGSQKLHKLEAGLTNYESRQLPFFIGGKAVSMSLPIVDLSEFPGAAGKQQAQEWAYRLMQTLSPYVKVPLELQSNFSFFFRNAIQNPDSPLVPAPAWVAHLPNSWKKKFGVQQIISKRTGKKELAWYGNVDYVTKQIPGVVNFLQNVSQPETIRGMGPKQVGIGFATGVRAVPLKTALQRGQLERLYKAKDDVTTKLRALSQGGVGAKNPTREYQQLKARMGAIDTAIRQAKQTAGYKVLPGGSKTGRRSGGSGRIGSGSGSGRIGGGSGGGRIP